MAENNPTPPVPPKPGDSKVQPKKETVRISLPPKPQAPQVKLPTNAPSINLIVPQVADVDTNVKIPNAAEVMTNAPTGAGPKPSAPPPQAPPPPPTAMPAPVAQAAAPAAPAVAPAKKPAAKPAPAQISTGGGVRTSKVDAALAVLAAIVAITGLVRVFMLVQ